MPGLFGASAAVMRVCRLPDPTPPHGYESTREAAMAAFARSPGGGSSSKIGREVRFRGQTRKHLLVLSLTAFDPSGHSEAFTRLAHRP